ncbi:unnamed protein product [Chironomus riparius]|uniref:Uncharacterized protein n=1 Tax=Chironomus riparius TaxID=315576 RepID=A0A9N9S5V5_9DIPT|nr:unnamed protein product [Chironomus riparius]
MDPREPIVNAYTSQEYTACLSLIQASPSEISSQTDMRILQASCLININGRSGEAHQILDKILELDPQNGLAFYGKGLAFLKESNLDKSFENFTKASELDKTGVISKAQIMKLKTEEMLKSKRTSNRLSGKQIKDNAAPITCEICNRSFAQLFSLNRHKLIHSGERPHKCSLCNFGFVQKSDLQRHMSVHNDNADFPCLSCEKKFKSKKNLSLHLMTHSVEKPFKCETCGKDFKYRRLMKLHQIIHSKRKKYNCDFCEKIFVTKPSLKAHVMMHINRMKKEGVKLSGGGGIVEKFEVSSGDLGVEMMNFKVEEQNHIECADMTSKLPVISKVTSIQLETEPTTAKLEGKLAKTKKYFMKKQQKMELPETSKQDQQSVKKSRGRPPKVVKKSLTVQNSNSNNLETSQQTISTILSTSLQSSPQTVRNSVRIQNRKSLGAKRSLIKTNPNSLSIRRESIGFDRNSATIQQKLAKVKNNLIRAQTDQQNFSVTSFGSNSVSPNPDQLFSTSTSSFSELFPQISIISNNAQKPEAPNTSATRFSLGNIELPSSLQIRPILGVQGSKLRSTRNSISRRNSTTENGVQLNLIPPTKFINPVTSSPQSSSVIPADPRISAIFSNPHISVAITSTSSSTTIAKSEMNSNPVITDSKWSNSTAFEVKHIQDEQVPIKDIKLEPVEVPNNDQQAETSSNHDSLFSSENEHPSEWNLFFKSLMHDLTKMDERQRRKFKQKTFVLIDDILQ